MNKQREDVILGIVKEAFSIKGVIVAGKNKLLRLATRAKDYVKGTKTVNGTAYKRSTLKGIKSAPARSLGEAKAPYTEKGWEWANRPGLLGRVKNYIVDNKKPLAIGAGAGGVAGAGGAMGAGALRNRKES